MITKHGLRRLFAILSADRILRDKREANRQINEVALTFRTLVKRVQLDLLAAYESNLR